jgi:hypothetical protein
MKQLAMAIGQMIKDLSSMNMDDEKGKNRARAVRGSKCPKAKNQDLTAKLPFANSLL